MKYSVDKVITRDNRVFAYGWAFHPEGEIASMELQLALSDGKSARLPVLRQKERADVAKEFPGVPTARYSGWLVYGAWSGAPVRVISLEGRIDGGESFSCLVRDESPSPVTTSLSVIARLRRKLRAIRDRGPVELVRTGRRLLERGTPSQEPGTPSQEPGTPSQEPGTPSQEPGTHSLVEELRSVLQEAKQERFPLVLDHQMGGGANVFSRHWVAERLRERPLALMLSFDILSLRYQLDILDSAGTRRQIALLEEPVTALAGAGLVDQVLYNDAVSFPRPEDVPAWLANLAQDPRTKLTLAVHDYLAVCPSQFLLNEQGRFCGVPDIGRCQQCLPRNDNEFARLFPSHDMPEWRARWGVALSSADRIVCFSASSLALLRRAYPWLPEDRISIEPHQVQAFDEHPVIDHGASLHIGVVGAIGWHKGAGVIQDLAAEIARRRLPVSITVIGSLDARVDPSVVRVTGSFKREQLPQAIAESGANVFLLPSICPETFSYVAHELMQMQVPVACFDFGAPADSVARYRLGRVLAQTTAADLLDVLLQFHSTIAHQHSVQA